MQVNSFRENKWFPDPVIWRLENKISFQDPKLSNKNPIYSSHNTDDVDPEKVIIEREGEIL